MANDKLREVGSEPVDVQQAEGGSCSRAQSTQYGSCLLYDSRYQVNAIYLIR